MLGLNVPILMYHGVSADVGPKFRPFVISPALFSAHLDHLQRQRYTPISVTQLVRARAAGDDEMLRRAVVLTFDDGFADFHRHALPALRQRGFGATLYVATAYVGGAARWLQREGEGDRPMMTWDQLADCGAGGIEVGGHSQRHAHLDTLPAMQVWDEVAGCRRALEDRLGREVLSFAYPFGHQTAATRRVVESAGYTSACAVRYELSRPSDDPFALARLLVPADMSVDRLAAMIERGDPAVKTAFRRARFWAWQLARRGAASLQRSGRSESGKIRVVA